MKFRFFELTGDELQAYLKDEAEEFRQRQAQRDLLLKEEAVESYQLNRKGNIIALIFKKGMQPPGMVKVKGGHSRAVRPRAKGKEAAARIWRQLLDEAKITTSCQEETCTRLRLPCFIAGTGPHGHGMVLYNSRVGHVGPKVIVEIPVAVPGDGGDPDPKPFAAPDCMKELEGWLVEKLHAEAKDYKHGNPCYVLPSKL